MNKITAKKVNEFVSRLEYNTEVNPEIWTYDENSKKILAFNGKVIIQLISQKGFRLFVEDILVIELETDPLHTKDKYDPNVKPLLRGIYSILFKIYESVIKEKNVIQLDNKVINYIDSYNQYFKNYIKGKIKVNESVDKDIDDTNSSNDNRGTIYSNNVSYKTNDSSSSTDSQQTNRPEFKFINGLPGFLFW